MPTKRERLDNLTTKVYEIIDDANGTAAGSVSAINADITAVQADIDALVAVANRNASQNVELRCLRRVIASLRNEKRLVRDNIVLARMILALDGSRIRPEDVNGSE
jgi:hypothetical protein